LSSFWLILKQQWTIEEISYFRNNSHLEWRVGLSDTILKGTHPGTTPARFGLIWFSGFRREDLNVIFYQNMPNLHNRYKSTERKISQKNLKYMFNYWYWHITKQQWTIKEILFSITAAILNKDWHCHTQFWRRSSKDNPSQVWFNLALWFLMKRFKCERLQHAMDWRHMIAKAHMAFGQVR
jgi:hypothetical protein